MSLMDGGAQQLLESVTQKTLHAHSFSRSSTQASLVLTDLLSKYISLLSSTCAKYARHAGRTSLSIHDAVEALDELGVSVEELSEYCATEGRELNRYALHSTRRAEDLNEFRVQLLDGLRQDRDDAIPLEYACYSPHLWGESEYEDEGEEDLYDIDGDLPTLSILDDMDVDIIPSTAPPLSRKPSPLRPTSPTLPLSPISNPSSSPSRKRQRTANWQPPEHIPDFLPPFPSTVEATFAPESPTSPRATLSVEPPPVRQEDVKVEKLSISFSQQPVTTAAASDFFVQVPYSQSSLSNLSERHLPQPPRGLSSSLSRITCLPVPQTEPSLFAAYHHILTHPPPPVPPPSNPLRHKVALAFLAQIQDQSRWDPPDTLFSSVQPCPPRAASIAPTHPIPIDPIADMKGKGDSRDKDVKLPPTKPRPVAANERLSPLISQQTSRLPDLSCHVLHPAIFARTTRLSHPPVLHADNKALVYGNGIPAPWNRKLPPDASTPGNGKAKGSATEKEPEGKVVIPDAQLYATWDYAQKNYKVPLRNRGRMGSMQAGGSGVISLPAIARSKGNK